MMNDELGGVLPPMTIPFDAAGEVDDAALRRQARWLLDDNVHGLVCGGSAGEGHTLEADELDVCLRTVLDEVDGRVPVVAGIIANSTRDAVRRSVQAQAAGAAALQVTPVHYLFPPDDDAMLAHFRAVAEATGLPVLIYNVVPWCYLSPELLCRIMHEVPGVVGVKQSAGDLKLLADLLQQTPPNKRIFTAIDALLYSSFTLGAHGAIAAILAAVPGIVMQLWDAVQRGDHRLGLQLHGRLLTLWNALAADNLPACVKYAQNTQGCPGGLPRAPMPKVSTAQRRAIDAALAVVRQPITIDAAEAAAV